MSGLLKGVEKWAIPVRLQQLYKGYKLEDVTIDEIVMPHTFLASLARVSNAVYKTGTVRSHSKAGSPQELELKQGMESSLGNYVFLGRFDAATGMIFETNGPFGAVVATCTLPGQEPDVPLTGHIHPHQPRYRIFVVFRGTSPGKFYWDDISTDLKAGFYNLDNPLGRKSGTLARGFLNTYMSCRGRVASLVNEAGRHLQERFRELAKGFTDRFGGRSFGLRGKLPLEQIELYVVGHSLGGAVATICAYDLAFTATRFVRPVLVTFGSPAVGDIDFAIDFQRMMVQDENRYSPYTGYLRSVRVVAQTAAKDEDIVTKSSVLPNFIHVNSRLSVTTEAANRLKAHSMDSSYIKAIDKLP
ncbi:Lipase (class 3) [Aquisphaera giovannonii]|uniref:Lipase (Class 3) n=1 Tax=Aquisphaera giovannonii TaxID=406548 RepID=A0A5B9WAK8_9BACT|nr:lipase family protein [Aquisphaera giovannonii]QEH37135.1 Lipase (class 3) [Aquisphaera giovannonii]